MGGVTASAPTPFWSSTVSNTPAGNGRGPLKPMGLSPESYCLVGHSHASLETSGTYLEDTSSLNKGTKRNGQKLRGLGNTGPTLQGVIRGLEIGPGWTLFWFLSWDADGNRALAETVRWAAASCSYCAKSFIQICQSVLTIKQWGISTSFTEELSFFGLPNIPCCPQYCPE